MEELSAPDLLRFVSTSRACRKAASLSYLHLNINDAAEMKALKGLHRLGCLQQLRKAHLKAVVSDPAALGHLTVLGCVHSLRSFTKV